MPEIVITDIDGTIIDDAGLPIKPVLDFIDAYDCDVVVVTNRPESEREATVKQLAELDLDVFRLYMNKDGAPAPEYKRAVVKELMDEGFDPQVFIDNRKDVRDAVAELGVQVIDPSQISNSETNDEDMSKTTPEALASKLTADLTAVTAERDALVSASGAATSELVTIKASFEAVTAERDALAAKVKELEAAQMSASAKAAEMVADKVTAVAQAPLNVAPASDAPAKLAGKDLKAAYLALSGKEQVEFFAKHKADLFAIRKAGL